MQLRRYADDMDRCAKGMDRYAEDMVMREELEEALRGRKAAMQELDSSEMARWSAEDALAACTRELSLSKIDHLMFPANVSEAKEQQARLDSMGPTCRNAEGFPEGGALLLPGVSELGSC